MKHPSKIFFIFLIICLSANSCKKDDDDKPDEPNYGPEYFECKINGEPFQAVSDFTCSGPRFNYYPEAFMGVPEGYMLLAGKDCINSPLCAIRIYGYDQSLGEMNFSNPVYADSISPFYSYFTDDNPDVILLDQLVNGVIVVEQLIPRESGNSPLGSIKGTFEFTVSDEQGIDTIRVTEGRFRFDVPQIF